MLNFDTMQKRNYPLFLIDRSKTKNYPNDYITCLDREVGFVAKVVFFPADDAWREFLVGFSQIEHNELAGVKMRLKRGGLALQVVDFLYRFEVTNETKARVQVLLKKALKKYLHAEAERTPHNDLGIDDQIKQQKLTLERAVQNYDDLVARANGSRDLADYQISLQRETVRTLERFREMRAFFNSGFAMNFNDDEN